jgi:hypothetical protein
MANTIIHPKPAHLAGDSAKFHSKLVGGKAKKMKKSMKTAMKGKKGKKPMRKTMKKKTGGRSFMKGIRNKLPKVFFGREKSGLTEQQKTEEKRQIIEEKKQNWWKDEYNKYIQDEICKKKNKLQCKAGWFSDGQQINDFVDRKWPDFSKKYKVQSEPTTKINTNLEQPAFNQTKENKISDIHNITKGMLTQEQHEYAGYLQDLCTGLEPGLESCKKQVN